MVAQQAVDALDEFLPIPVNIAAGERYLDKERSAAVGRSIIEAQQYLKRALAALSSYSAARSRSGPKLISYAE